MPFSWIMELQHASSTILRVKLKSNISRCLVHWDALRHYINTNFDISKDCEEALPTQTKRWNCDAGQVSKARRTETSLNFEQSLHISTHVYTTIWPRWLRWSALRIYSALAQGFKLAWMVALGRGRVNVSPKSSDESCCCGITISSPSPYLEKNKKQRDVPYKYRDQIHQCHLPLPSSEPKILSSASSCWSHWEGLIRPNITSCRRKWTRHTSYPDNNIQIPNVTAEKRAMQRPGWQAKLDFAPDKKLDDLPCCYIMLNLCLAQFLWRKQWVPLLYPLYFFSCPV